MLAEFVDDKNVLGQLSKASVDHAVWDVAAVMIDDALKNLPRWTVVVERDLRRMSLRRRTLSTHHRMLLGQTQQSELLGHVTVRV